MISRTALCGSPGFLPRASAFPWHDRTNWISPRTDTTSLFRPAPPRASPPWGRRCVCVRGSKARPEAGGRDGRRWARPLTGERRKIREVLGDCEGGGGMRRLEARDAVEGSISGREGAPVGRHCDADRLLRRRSGECAHNLAVRGQVLSRIRRRPLLCRRSCEAPARHSRVVLGHRAVYIPC